MIWQTLLLQIFFFYLLLWPGLLRYKVDFQSMEYDDLDDLDYYDDDDESIF